jgi:hypothetical protein
MTLNLYAVTDIIGTITANGPAVNVTTTTPGQNALYTFSVTQSQRVSLLITNVNFSGVIGFSVPRVSIVGPSPSNTEKGNASAFNGSNSFIDTVSLSAGTYTVKVDPQDFSTGSLTLTLYTVPNDISGTISANGTATTVSITTPGQNASLTFSGTQHQRISLLVSNVTLPGGFCGGDVIIQKPLNGGNLASTSACSGRNTFIRLVAREKGHNSALWMPSSQVAKQEGYLILPEFSQFCLAK